jgi:hypothetical protein
VKLQHIESTSTGISTEILYSAIQQVGRLHPAAPFAPWHVAVRCLCDHGALE